MFSYRLLLLLVLFNSNLKGQDILGSIPASAGTWSKSCLSSSAALFNPAALGHFIPVGIVLQSRQPFLLKGLSELQCYAVIPLIANTGLFLGCRRFGNTDFNELLLSTGYGMQLKKWLQVGINVHIATSRVRGFARSGTIIPAASLQFISKAFVSGVFIQYQPQAPAIKAHRYGLVGLGIGKDWSSQLYTDLNLCYGNGTGLNTQVSLQYQVLSAWCLVIKIQTRPLVYAFETGYIKDRLSIRICSDWHPQLGFSPGLFLGYSVKPIKGQNDQDYPY